MNKYLFLMTYEGSGIRTTSRAECALEGIADLLSRLIILLDDNRVSQFSAVVKKVNTNEVVACLLRSGLNTLLDPV